MKIVNCSCDRFEVIVRGLARFVSVLSMGLLVVFAVGGGVPNPLDLPLREALALNCLGGILIGLAIAFWNEILGAGIALGSWVVFQAIEIGANDHPAFNVAFAAMVAPAVLYLIIPIWRRWKAGMVARQAPPVATPPSPQP
jgi:hypothetical protein